MSVDSAVLLLGRRDEPTDGVADYCEKLREAAAARGLSFEIAQVRWAEKGWSAALAELREAATAWRGRWVFLQFTTLAWSFRGFPLRSPAVLDTLKKAGAHPAVVFHDFTPVRGWGVVGYARSFAQSGVLRRLYARSSLAAFTVPVEKIGWLPKGHEKARFIPVGSNFPLLQASVKPNDNAERTAFTVAVFGFTDGPRGSEEVADIAYALRGIQSRGIRVRLVAIGRGSASFEQELRGALSGSGIELSVLGLLAAEDLARALSGAHALLCIRGHISSRRGSAIAGIVCGVPIVGYRGEDTGFPITEAGVILVDQHDREGLVRGLAQVLTDEEVYLRMRERSLQATQKYFSWDAIASQFAEAISSS
jgi:glycosyltransferase involved in cell wall biosynthesis